MEYNDVIHGKINLPKHIYSIIQTPYFKRLKKIKQLGLTYITLPQANGNRYDHCIGTYCLADKTLDALEKNTKNLTIPDFYKKVVTIAALLHDIGHGPFSHMWEVICSKQYHHEENASALIDEIFKVCLLDWDVEDRPYAIDLIKALIVGDHSCLRHQEYRFIFDIVNNKNCGVDVDKWDYLQRDSFHSKDLIIPDVNLDFEDVFLKARVSDDRSRIEYRYCDFRKMYNIFDARTTFHIYLYRRPISVCMENIFKYIMSECKNDLMQLNGLKLTDIRSQHVDAFLQLNDDEVWRILSSLDKPQEIVELVNCIKMSSLCEIYPETEEEKLLIPDHLKAVVQIDNPGEELNSKNIIFYGNIEEKPSFELKRGSHESVSYYKII